MRKIINISVPEPMQQFIKQRIDTGEFDSMSDYFRKLVRLDQKQERSKAQSAAMQRHHRENPRPTIWDVPDIDGY